MKINKNQRKQTKIKEKQIDIFGGLNQLRSNLYIGDAINMIIKSTFRIKGSKILSKIIPGFSSIKNYNRFLLCFGLPHCCWSVGRFLVSNPLGFSIKNFIFYFKLFFINN